MPLITPDDDLIDLDEKTTTQQPASLSSPNKFTEKDFSFLNENEHVRFAPNSKKIGHAVIMKQDEDVVAQQYALPASDNKKGTPVVRPLINIEAIQPFPGMQRFRAETPDHHTTMYAKRSITGTVGDGVTEEPIEIACFSPEPNGKAPFWGSIKETPLFRTDLSKSVKKDLRKELAEIKPVTKGGSDMVIDHASVPQRDLIKTRTPDQNTVMGESARDAYEHFFDKLIDELHPEMKERLKRSFQADLKEGLYKNSHRPEWLHLYGWSLTPINVNSQKKSNLGAAPKWANTEMMILERIIKWFALHVPESLLTIKPKFDMLLDSELVKHIDFSVRIQIKERYVSLVQSIDPFLKYPLFPKASDLAQGAGITHSILNREEPVSTQVVKGLRSKIVTTNNKDETTMPKAKNAPKTKQPVLPPEDDLPPPSANRRKRKGDEISREDAGAPANKKAIYPTHNEYQRSVVQIYTDFFIPNYDIPWHDGELAACSGSGLIILDPTGQTDKKYILTNAHVAENHTFIQVRLANNRTNKYPAKVFKRPGYQCDLAVLEIDDPEFQAAVKSVEFGDMVSLRDKVVVVGFPMGGSEISLSKGIVSRIEVDEYCQSGQELLVAQVDAAVNPGNSGGPVFSGDKVIGVAFQGYGGHQGLSYIIPMPIVKHFLEEMFSNKPYRGFPTLPIQINELENTYEREFYGMGDKTGLHIKKVHALTDCKDKLQPGDILISIDGLPISNEGTVDIPGIGNCIDFKHVCQSKFIGDSVTLGILRKDTKKRKVVELEVDVTLDNILGDTFKIPTQENDKMPTYYFNTGLCFIPATRNYLDGDGYELDEMRIDKDGGTLANAAKEDTNEQVIVISHILSCYATHGYDKHLRGIVKEINGIKIINIHDVIRAMEENQGKTHVIVLKDDSKIILPNMTAQEQANLLKRNHISNDRSEDLRKEATPIVAPIPLRRQHAIPFWANKKPTRRLEESVSETESQEEEQEEIALTRDMLPGLRRYQEFVSGMEARYQDVGDEDDDEEYALDDLGAGSDEEESQANDSSMEVDELEADESAAEEVMKPHQKPSRGGARRHSFFKPTVMEVDAPIRQLQRK